MDKYELAEILTAAANGIKDWSNEKKALAKLDGLRRVCYNFCKATVIEEYEKSYASIQSPVSDDLLTNIIIKVQKFDKAMQEGSGYNYGNTRYMKNRADELYKQLTSEEPPKED